MTEPERHPTEPEGEDLARFWTPSNVVSMLRVPLTAAALYLIWLGSEYRMQLCAVILAAVVTDIVDGFLARRRREITRWGKILDPLADKLAIDSVAVALILLRDLPVWVGVAVVGRDVAILIAGVFLVSREGLVFSSNLWGKLTSVVMSALLLTYAMDADPFKIPLLWAAAAVLAISTVSYGARFLRFLRAGAR